MMTKLVLDVANHLDDVKSYLDCIFMAAEAVEDREQMNALQAVAQAGIDKIGLCHDTLDTVRSRMRDEP